MVVVALTTIILFLFAWIEEENDEGELQSVAGITIAMQNVAPTEDFPSPLLLTVPLVAGSMIYQYGKRVRHDARPRRRLESATMILTGIFVMVLWLRVYTNNVVTNTPEADVFSGIQPISYTREEVLQELITPYYWLTLVGLFLLMVLPWFDWRRLDDPPAYLNPTRPLNQ
jgi:hypothetical protein